MKEAIIKSIRGHFYYAKLNHSNIILPVLLPSIYKKNNINLFVGDKVLLDVQNKIIQSVLPRYSLLPRPKVANVDLALIIMPSTSLDTEYLDKLLCLSSLYLPEKPLICVTKKDLIDKNTLCIMNTYSDLGYKVFFLNNLTGDGIDDILPFLYNKLSVVAGLSGAGKTSFVNSLDASLKLKTAPVSIKTARGTHTTTHVEILEICKNNKSIFIIDTPGFSRLYIPCFTKELLNATVFPELETEKVCKFANCTHREEEGCAIKFLPTRKKSYIKIYKEAEDYEKQQLEDKKKDELNPKFMQEKNKDIPRLKKTARLISRKKFKQNKKDLEL